MGLIQREIEANGISTISVSSSKEITRKVRPPRALFPGFPLGQPIGFPGQTALQIKVMRLLLMHLKNIEDPGTLIELDLNESGNGMSL